LPLIGRQVIGHRARGRVRAAEVEPDQGFRISERGDTRAEEEVQRVQNDRGKGRGVPPAYAAAFSVLRDADSDCFSTLR
jgi:hypothetical protein